MQGCGGRRRIIVGGRPVACFRIRCPVPSRWPSQTQGMGRTGQMGTLQRFGVQIYLRTAISGTTAELGRLSCSDCEQYF